MYTNKRNKKNRKQGRRRPKNAQATKMGVPTLNNSWTTISRQAPLFPDSMRQRSLRYFDFAQTITVAVGVCATRFFSANGLFDPDITGIGHQPMGFDQMMLMYNQYYVMNSSIRITGLPEAAGAVVGIYLSPDTTAITDPIRLIENGQMKYAHLDNTSSHLASLSLDCNVTKYFGRKGPRAVLNDPQLQGNATTNPTEQVYFGVVVFNFYSSAVGVTFDYDVELVYDAMFTERKKLIVS